MYLFRSVFASCPNIFVIALDDECECLAKNALVRDFWAQVESFGKQILCDDPGPDGQKKDSDLRFERRALADKTRACSSSYSLAFNL